MDTLMQRRRAMMLALSGQAHLIPAEYQQVEWIASSGTQYIWLKDVVSTFKTDGWGATMVAQNNGQTSGNAGLLAHGIGLGFWAGQTGNTFANNGAPMTDPTELGIYWSQLGLETSSSYGTGGRTYGKNAPEHRHLTIFGISQDGYSVSYMAKAKIFSMTITKAGETFRNFVPCYRKADGVIGLYDTVTQRFYTNDGTGAFTKGADV